MALYLKSNTLASVSATEYANINDLKPASEIIDEYTSRVVSDGGSVKDPLFLESLVTFLRANNMYSKVHTMASVKLGISEFESGSKTLVPKLYNLGYSGDLLSRIYERVILGSEETNVNETKFTEYTKEVERTVSGQPAPSTPALAGGVINTQTSDGSYTGYYNEMPDVISQSGNMAVLFVGEVDSPLGGTAIYPVGVFNESNRYENGGSSPRPFMLAIPKSSDSRGVRLERVRNGKEEFYQYNPIFTENPATIDKVFTGFVDTANGNVLVSGFDGGVPKEFSNTLDAGYPVGLDKPSNFYIGTSPGITASRVYKIRFKHAVLLSDCTQEQVLAMRDFLSQNI